MPCLVPIVELVSIDKAAHLVPEAMRGFIAKLVAEPNDRTTWSALADWLTEEEQSEAELAAAIHYFLKRPELKIVLGSGYAGKSYHSIDKLKGAVAYADHGKEVNNYCPVGAMADLAFRLTKAKEDLS